MTSPGDKFLDAAADHLNVIDEIVDEHRLEFARIYIEVLEEPERRNPGIIEYIIGYMHEVMADETDSEELADLYWEKVDEYLDLTWDEINEVPMPERGDVYHTARKVISGIASRQAFIESGIAQLILLSSYSNAPVVGKLFGAMTPAEQKKTAVESDLKTRKKERKKPDDS